MSIRLRLTFLYTAILALTLALFSVALYFTVQRTLFSSVEAALKVESERFIANVQRDLGLDQFTVQDTYFQILGPDGAIARRSRNLYAAKLPLSKRGLADLQRGKQLSETQPFPNGEGRWLIYNKPIVDDGRTIGILQTARKLVDQDEALSTLKRLLLLGGGIATLGAFGVGWLLAGAALRPINRITQTAQEIGRERDFDRRVRYDGPHDEVGRLATTFNTMLSQLGAAYQAQRRLVADASHELRTPLTTVRGNIGLLQREPPISGADRAAVLSDMAEESERMSRLVNDLLVLARADAGRALAAEPIALGPFLEDLCRQAAVLAPDRVVDCGEHTHLAVLGDRDALKQVLLILLDNSLKYTPSGGAIRIAARGEGHQVSVEVRDTGPGIPPDVLAHIFERFYRADTARTGGGAGLGLAIAKTLVESQGGAISVKSEPGEGSVFLVSLPRAADLAPHPNEALDRSVPAASRGG